MPTLTLTEKGQFTVNKQLQRHIGVKPGDKIEVDLMPDGTLRVGPVRRTGKIEDFFGSLKGKSKKSLTIDEINKVIENAWAGKHKDAGE